MEFQWKKKYEVRDAELVCDTFLEDKYEGVRGENGDVSCATDKL